MDTITFQLVTFNVGGVEPADVFGSIIQPGFDIYVFALQEIDQSLQTIMSSKCTAAASYVGFIRARLPQHIVEYDQYGYLLMVTARLPHISQLPFRARAVGAINMKNKGAIACTFAAGDSTFQVIAAHLSANKKKKGLDERNRNLAKIFSALAEDADVTALMGDLNYRLQCQNYADLIRAKNHLELLKHDELYWQLNPDAPQVLLQEEEEDEPEEPLANSQRFSEIFDEEHTFVTLHEFKEADIHFNPTYKVDNGFYDLSRTPSYCDRVLLRGEAAVTRYDSIKVKYSDHYPVVCEGVLRLRLPKNINVHNHTVVFKYVRFGVKHVLYYEIENLTGQELMFEALCMDGCTIECNNLKPGLNHVPVTVQLFEKRIDIMEVVLRTGNETHKLKIVVELFDSTVLQTKDLPQKIEQFIETGEFDQIFNEAAFYDSIIENRKIVGTLSGAKYHLSMINRYLKALTLEFDDGL